MADLRRLTAIIEREDTGYVALCPEYDVASEGVTIEEARDNLIEALTLFFESADPAELDRRYRPRSSLHKLRLELLLDLKEARRVAETEGVALNQFINVAVAEKLSALRTDDYFRERAARGDVAKAKQILKRAGRGKPPVRGDELD